MFVGGTGRLPRVPRMPSSRLQPVGLELSYSTSFDSTENPISESGRWAKNASNAWTVVRTTGGNAVGTQAGNDYDDSYAIFQTDYGADYKLTAIVYRSASISAANHEVELNVRFADDADSVRGYEVLLNKDGSVQCFRWNDSFGSFTEITASGTNSMGSVPDGATFEVRISGDTITMGYHETGGTAVDQCTFDIGSIAGTKYTTGNPAIAFFCRPTGDGSNPDHFGFKSVTVTKL